PLREGAYYGNLFQNGGLEHIYACSGPGSNVPQITNRFCSGAQGVCAIQVRFDCLNPAPRRAGAIFAGLGARYGRQRQDPTDGSVLDCWTGGVSAANDDAQGKRFREVITVYLKEPVAICGDGVCTGSETAASCPSDCRPGWARGLPGLLNLAAGVAPLAGGDLGLLVQAGATTDLGTGTIKGLPSEMSVLLARLDGDGRTRWSRQIATASFGTIGL